MCGHHCVHLLAAMPQLSRALVGMFATLGALATSPWPEWTNDTQGEKVSGIPQPDKVKSEWNRDDTSWTEPSLQQTGGETKKPILDRGPHSFSSGWSMDCIMVFGGVQGQTYSNSLLLLNGDDNKDHRATCEHRLPKKPERPYIDEAVMHRTDLPAKGLNMMFMLSGAALVLVLFAAKGYDWVRVSGKRLSSEDERPALQGPLMLHGASNSTLLRCKKKNERDSGNNTGSGRRDEHRVVAAEGDAHASCRE